MGARGRPLTATVIFLSFSVTRLQYEHENATTVKISEASHVQGITNGFSRRRRRGLVVGVLCSCFITVRSDSDLTERSQMLSSHTGVCKCTCIAIYMHVCLSCVCRRTLNPSSTSGQDCAARTSTYFPFGTQSRLWWAGLRITLPALSHSIDVRGARVGGWRPCSRFSLWKPDTSPKNLERTDRESDPQSFRIVAVSYTDQTGFKG